MRADGLRRVQLAQDAALRESLETARRERAAREREEADVRRALAESAAATAARAPTTRERTREDTSSDAALARALQATDDAALARALQAQLDGEAASAPPPRPRPHPPEMDDEAMARALQARLHVGPSPNGAPPARDRDTCGGCGERFGMFDFRPRIVALGRSWHQGCFKCAGCKQPIVGSEFSHHDDGAGPEPWHSECYLKARFPYCAVCGAHIVPDASGRAQWLQATIFADKVCPKHAHDGTPRCSSCGRWEPRSSKDAFVSLPGSDGRKTCLECLSASAVLSDEDVEPLYRSVRAFFDRAGLHVSGPTPPLHMVDQGTLAAAAERESETVDIRGLCMSMEHRIVAARRGPSSGTFSFVENLVPRRVGVSVTGLLVIIGMPRVMCGSVVAHEYMHAYIKMAGFPQLPPVVEEGLCQLLGLLWVESDASDEGTSATEATYATLVSEQIRTDRSPVYGDGLRAALAAYKKHGLGSLLAHVKRYASFPPP